MASGANTPVAHHSIGTKARAERPCARNPAVPNIAAHAAATVRCEPYSKRSGSGIAGAVGPEGAIRATTFIWTAQSAITAIARIAATGTAPTAASARHAIATVAAVRATKAVS